MNWYPDITDFSFGKPLRKALEVHRKYPSKNKAKKIGHAIRKEIYRRIELDVRNDIDRMFFIEANQE